MALPSLAVGGVGDSITPPAGWPDAGSAGGVAGGSPLAGVLVAAPDVAGWVSTGPVALLSLAEVGAEADGSSAVVLTLAGLELV